MTKTRAPWLVYRTVVRPSLVWEIIYDLVTVYIILDHLWLSPKIKFTYLRTQLNFFDLWSTLNVLRLPKVLAAITQMVERQVSERKVMVTPGPIPKLAKRCCVLGKDTLRSFPIDSKQ